MADLIVRDLARIQRFDILPRLLEPAAGQTARLVKTPKLHMTDTGLACALLGVEAEDLSRDRTLLGQLLETFVVQELRRQASGWEHDVRFSHYRDKDQQEVDIVLERGPNRIVGIEVKAAATLRAADRRGLERLRDAAGESFRCGALLYDGETLVPMGDRIYAVPLGMVWGD